MLSYVRSLFFKTRPTPQLHSPSSLHFSTPSLLYSNASKRPQHLISYHFISLVAKRTASATSPSSLVHRHTLLTKSISTLSPSEPSSLAYPPLKGTVDRTSVVAEAIIRPISTTTTPAASSAVSTPSSPPTSPVSSVLSKKRGRSPSSPTLGSTSYRVRTREPVSYGTSVFFSRSISVMSTNLTPKEDLIPDGDRGQMRIHLTDQEAAICDVLDKVSKYVEETTGTKVELRVAGGWVRDKLLGLSSHDLDIAIDSMMGYDFAVHVNEYMAQHGHEKRTIAKIATNPEKSKHLETATMVVHGIPLDFVNLRSEVYDDASRIPSEITFGTPSEDAERRDITINALFYNIHTHEVEDFTGKGLDDLKDGLIRTPLEPFETFWQDPLRVMRVIRFAARYQFTLVEEAKRAILDERIKQALKTKISKERIGAELDKMIDDNAGRSTAIRLLNELSLYDVVFAPPEPDGTIKGTSAVHGPIHNTDDAFKVVWILEWLLKINPAPVTVGANGLPERGIYQAEIDVAQEVVLKQARQIPDTTSHLYAVVRSTTPTHSSLIPQSSIKEDAEPEKLATRNLILAGMLYPYRDMSTTVNKKPMTAAAWIMRYCLKGRNIDIDIVTKLMESVRVVQEIINRLTPVTPFSGATSETSLTFSPEEEQRRRVERAEMGMIIRDIGASPIIGKKWQSAVLLALAIDLLPKFEILKSGVLDDETKTVMKKYNDFLVTAYRYEIDHSFGWKYIVDGKDLTMLLKIKPGPKVTSFLRKVMYWQLMYPHGSKQQCQEWILQNSELFQ